MKKTLALSILIIMLLSGVSFGMAHLTTGVVLQNSISVYITGLQYADSAYDYFDFTINGTTYRQSSSSKNFTGLSCGTTYSFSAVASYNGVEYDMGGFNQATDACPPPPDPPSVTAPSSVSGSALNQTMAQLSWSGGSPQNYQVELRRTSDDSLIWNYTGTVTSLTVSNLTQGTTYYARARTRAWYDYGGYYVYSGWTNSANFTTQGEDPPPTPDPITGVSVSGVTENSATVSWTGGANLETFTVKIKQGTSVVRTEVTLNRSFTFSNLDPHTTYTACVFGCERQYNCSAEICSAPFTTDHTVEAWQWSIPIEPGSPVYNTTISGTSITAYVIPATEWNQFTSRINELRALYGRTAYTFTTVSSGTDFTLAILNQAVMALNGIFDELPLASGENVQAQHMKMIRDKFNEFLYAL